MDLSSLNIPTMNEIAAERVGKPKGRALQPRTAACRQCGVAIKYRSPSRPVKFCSRKCAGIFHGAASRSRRQPCPICGIGVRPRNSRVCSVLCMNVLRRVQPQRTCPVCHVEYRPYGRIRLKYCSKRCYDRVRSADAFETFNCAKCNKAVARPKVRTRPKTLRFCSRECSKGFIVGPAHALWRGGSDPNRGAGWVKLAEKMRARDGYMCRRCGLSQFENGEALAVDHIKPWRSFENKAEANDPLNLASLCKKCHGYKTTKVERAWLRGDRIEMAQYEKAVSL